MFNKFGAVNSIRDGKYREVVGEKQGLQKQKKKVPNKVIESSEIKTYIVGRGKSLVLSY